MEEDAAIIMNQVLSAVFYCHSQGVCHRDIKPENILLADKSMQLDDLKLIDFGLAALFDDYEHERFMDKVGSSYYMAPEILGPDGHGPKADIWSCGVVCYILLCGGAPFDGDDGEQIMDAIAFGEFTFADDPIWEEVSEEAKDFIAYLLTYDENERPTAEQALKHPWLENVRSTSSQGFVERESIAAIKSLGYLENFRADCKLKQAVCAFIASQILTRREKDMIDSLFRTLDTNCDGKLSREELRLGFEIFQGKDLAEDDLDDIFRRVNFCGSGVIEYSEFVVASMQDLFDETKLRAAFNIFDKEGKGYLTSDCIKEVIAVPGNDEMTERALEQIMSQVRNSKGRISFEDFEEAMLGASTSSATDTDTDDSDKNQHDSQNLRSSLTTTTRRSLQRTSHILFWEDDSFGSCCTSSTVIKPPVFSESQSLGPADIARKTIKLTEPRIKATRSLVAHTHSLSYARIYAVGRGS